MYMKYVTYLMTQSYHNLDQILVAHQQHIDQKKERQQLLCEQKKEQVKQDKWKKYKKKFTSI